MSLFRKCGFISCAPASTHVVDLAFGIRSFMLRGAPISLGAHLIFSSDFLFFYQSVFWRPFATFVGAHQEWGFDVLAITYQRRPVFAPLLGNLGIFRAHFLPRLKNQGFDIYPFPPETFFSFRDLTFG